MPEPNDPFYVGYAPLPKRLRPWVLRFVLVWLVGLAGFAVVLATKQQDPGPGEWDLSKQVAIEGLLRVDPYPVLFVHDPKAGDLARAVLLVSEFKFGAQDRTQPFAGQAVRLQGHFISRGGRGMFELSSESDAIQALPNLGPNPEPTLAPTREPLGPCTLQGEIADSKCFLGVMKPGFGKTHRACAVRCISGGITPIFVT
ncbi:MAG TPA: hypothetical protein P5218_06765, partial [Planctomycetota bacterium]|nr:hypothetical protein [Planctomycetota bacterium]